MDLFAWDWDDQNPQGTGFWRCRCSRKSYNVVPAQALMELFLAEESGIHKRPDITFQGIHEQNVFSLSNFTKFIYRKE